MCQNCNRPPTARAVSPENPLAVALDVPAHIGGKAAAVA